MSLKARIERVVENIRARERDFRDTSVWACQCDASWHADEFKEWADELQEALSTPEAR